MITLAWNSFENSSSILDDHVEYSLPWGMLSETLVSALINNKLNQMFDYRHRLISDDLLVHAIANKMR
jgi:ligand-binding SRPBCC domain-containing protein